MSVVVPEGTYGWPGIAFGGYVAGLLGARSTGGDQRVDFLRPTPLGVPLELSFGDDGGRLADGQVPLAVCRPTEVDVTVPEPPTWEEALRATGEHMTESPLVTADCFGCGYGRAEGEGLRQLLGLHPVGGLVAAAWRPAPSLGDADGVLPDELAWAALDCPAGMARVRLTDAPHAALTANLSARLVRPIAVDERHVVFGWLISRIGRKTVLGSAVATEHGELCALAESLWIDAR